MYGLQDLCGDIEKKVGERSRDKGDVARESVRI